METKISLDDLVFLILKATDRPLSMVEILEHLYDWQAHELKRKGGWRSLIPRGFIKMSTYLLSGVIYEALELLIDERRIYKRYRLHPGQSAFGVEQPPIPREYAVLKRKEKE